MKYLITDNNVKWDNTFANTMYFLNEVDRDTFVNNNLHENYLTQLEAVDETFGVTLSPRGGTIEIEWKGSMEELWTKNTIILKESVKSGKPTFWFIDDIQQMDNNNMYELQLTPNLFLSYPGILEHNPNLELLEGHVNDGSLLDVKLDAGYRAPMILKPLERDFDWYAHYPDNDITGLNTQWLYVFIKTPQANSGQTLFLYNGQRMPYRILIAPMDDILIEPGDSTSQTLAVIDEEWSSLYYNIKEDLNPGDNDLSGSTSKLETIREHSVSGEIFTDQDLMISTTFKNTKRYVRIPQSKLTELYTNQWNPIFISNISQSTIDSIQNSIFNDKSPSGSDEVVGTVLLFQYDSIGQKFKFSAPSRDNDVLNKPLDRVHFKIKSHRERSWELFVPGSWEDQYSGESTGFHLTAHCKIPFWTVGLSGVWSIALTTFNFEINGNDFDAKVLKVYQGDENSEGDLYWTKNRLISYINEQSNATEGESEIIGAKISSYNPLEMSGLGDITNIKGKDSTTTGWVNDEVIELFSMDYDKSYIFNTYDLTKYKEKSWISGMENYSIVIESNKEFMIKPELVYTDGKFVHKIIPTPNEWVERIIWSSDVNNDGYSWQNNKELLFANNAFVEYQVNNPEALNNQRFNNTINSLKAVTELGVGLKGGGAGAVAGINAVGNNIIDRVNYKSNIKGMKEQPAISTGSGAAYADLYLNKNGFGLGIIEWIYTTSQAPSLIDSLIRNGISYDQSIWVKAKSIKRPEFNYIKINNGNEALSKSNLAPYINNQFAEIFNKGVRLWYNYDNFMDFDVENNSMFTKDMINYIDWNNTETEK